MPSESLLDNEGVRCRLQPFCAVCGAPGRIWGRNGLRDQLFGAPGRWGLLRCTAAACAQAWLAPMPVPEDVALFYRDYYTHIEQDDAAQALAPLPPVPAPAPTRGVKRWLARWLPGRRYALLSALHHLEDLPPGRLLEIGCGHGHFLAEAAASGWDALGLDFDPKAIEVAKRRPGVQARVGDPATLDAPEASFDAVLMNNVIEHVPDAVQVLATCHRMLRPGGRLVVLTPNFASLGRRCYGSDWRGLEIPRHLQVFTAGSLASAAVQAGFSQPHVFSSAGGANTVSILQASRTIRARRLGQPEPAMGLGIAVLAQLEKLGLLLGLGWGEWIVLVAHRGPARS